MAQALRALEQLAENLGAGWTREQRSLGATVLFIVRYCKEATGGLDDAQSRLLAEHLHKLEKRRTSLGAQKFSRTWKPNLWIICK